ncbi:hypothetical protein CK203_001415 [Vitis vinifera]|uniref:Uncharacterized protein n=1 Tax=Vitis vinifera TaxID=29760 RepID=A0A438KM49_VITVI|nr:hypothetical protein CK203_105122 [Vitis vinifera]RVX22272.1 hypothetical protein CK203_001415 [Vitis vinifera]
MAEGKGGGKGMGAREQGLHQDDADEDDENVKQLQQCSSLYLLLQDCLVKTDRNWRSCQKGMLFPSFFVAFVVLFCE